MLKMFGNRMCHALALYFNKPEYWEILDNFSYPKLGIGNFLPKIDFFRLGKNIYSKVIYIILKFISMIQKNLIYAKLNRVQNLLFFPW